MVALTEPRKPQTLMDAIRHFDRETARAYVQSIKWPDGPVCAKCGSVDALPIPTRQTYQCRDCRKQYSLTVGTIFAGTHLRLDQWCLAVWMIVNCRNGVSSCEIARNIDCKQQSAWHLLHRVRHCLQQDRSVQLGGMHRVVEADSTYIGGILSFMSYDRQQRAKASGGLHGAKSVVHAIKDRAAGTVRASVFSKETRHPERQEIIDNVATGSRLYTDAAYAYRWADGSVYRHHSVNHSAMEYVRGTVHTNGCENFFNCLRRGIKGTYIRPTPEHLEAYVDETVFRFNHRKETDWERFNRAMHLIVGKRLTYSELTDGAVR